MLMNRKIKRILALMTACLMLLGGASALADQIYANGPVAVYAQPSEGAAVLGALKAGAKVRVAAEKNGWAMLTNGTAVAYVKSSGLIKVEDMGNVTAYTSAAAPMYRSYTAASKPLGTVPAGAAVTGSARAGDMAYVKYGKYRGFVEVAKLTAQAPEKSETPVSYRTDYVAKDGAKVYSAKGKAVGRLPLNAALTLTGARGGVCQVKRDGATAYMFAADLSDSPVSAPAETQAESAICTSAFVNKDGAKVYDARGNAVGALSLNAAVTVTAVKGDVCQVTSGGRTAYMLKADLSCDRTEAQPVSPAPAAPAAPAAATAYANKEGAQVFDIGGNALGALSLNAAVTVTAVKGDVCQVTSGGRTAYMKKADLSASKTEVPKVEVISDGVSTVAPARGTAKEMDWWTSDIQTIFARGTVAQITDVATGISWREQRRGGTNHADCQPLTAADTAAMKKAYGGTWSWSRRAIFVTINGVNYAASMNGMPHGGGSIADNDFNGHHCIHFTNSRTHGGNKVCPLHQAAIQKAAAARM